MVDPTHSNTQKRGERRVTAADFPTPADTIVEALRRYSAKFIATRLKTSQRTVESWKQGKSAPQARHTLAMLNDEELCAQLLKAAGRSDLAHAQETIAALRKALSMVEAR
jgi:hypothetical protein